MVLLLVLLSTSPFLRTASRLDLEKYSTGFLSSPSAMCSSSTRSMMARTWRSWRSAALRYFDGNASAILTIYKPLRGAISSKFSLKYLPATNHWSARLLGSRAIMSVDLGEPLLRSVWLTETLVISMSGDQGVISVMPGRRYHFHSIIGFFSFDVDCQHWLGIGHHGAGHMFMCGKRRLDAQFVRLLFDPHELVGNVAFLDNNDPRHAGADRQSGFG